MTHWVDEFFDEDYLLTYRASTRQLGLEKSEQEALAAAALAGVPGGAELLDAPCGFGRHAVPLARAGYRVTGLDRSEVQLAEARRIAGAGDWPRLVQGDMRELPFPPKSFDGVLCLFTSVGYFGEEGDRATLAEFRRVLRPGGVVVLETMHRDRLVRIFEPRTWHRLPGGELFLAEREFDVVGGIAAASHTVVREGRSATRSHTVRTYTVTELVALLHGAGFDEVACYGNLDGAELTTESRLAAVAR